MAILTDGAGAVGSVRPVRIVVDGRMLAWTGIGRYTRHLLDELSGLDDRNEYLVLVAAGDGDRWRPGAANFERRVTDLRPYSLAEQRHLGRQIEVLRPDLVHFTHFNVPLRYRDPFVVTIHDLTMLRFKNVGGTSLQKRLASEGKYRALHWTMRSAVRRARCVLTPSRHTAGEVARRFGRPAGRITVTYEATEDLPVDPVPLPELDDGRPFLLHVGNFYPHKNVAALVAAMEALAADRPELRLVLAGAPDHFQRRLADRVATGALGDRVVFAGRVEDATLAWLYGHATLLVLPSLSEGFGLPGLEAMARGLPVAASRASCLPEIYGDAAAYFDPLDPGDLVRCVVGVLDDPGRREALVRAGEAKVREYSWRRMAEQTLRCYEQALAAPAEESPA